MIIMLARNTSVTTNEQGPSWALQGGNSPEIIQECVAWVSNAVRKLHSFNPLDQETGKELLAKWKDEVQRIADRSIPEKKWDATHVNFYFVPKEAVKIRIFRTFDSQEACCYWLEGESALEYKLVEIIEIEEILKYL